MNVDPSIPVLADETQTQNNTEADFTQPHIVGQHGTLMRVLRVPMEFPAKSTMKSLHQAMAIAADYANAAIVEWWIKKAWQIQKSPTTYVDYGQYLSSYARDAISDRVKALIRRHGRNILRHEQQLPTFVKDAALVVRADSGHCGARVDGEAISIRAQAEWLTVRIYTKALKRDWYLADTLTHIRNGDYALKRVAVCIRRRKLFFHLTYSKPAPATLTNSEVATLAFNETGELWLRSGHRSLNLTRHIFRLRHMKTHFAGIQSRLRRSLGKSGDRQRLRRALLRRQTFTEWAEGPIGQLSSEVTRWCVAANVGELNVTFPADGFVPWHRILESLQTDADETPMRLQLNPADEDLKRDWERLAAMAKAEQDFLRLGPPYHIYVDDPEIGTPDSGEKGE